MEYIVSSSQQQKIATYIKAKLGKNLFLVEAEDREIGSLQSKVQWIEPNFELGLGYTFWHDLGELGEEKIILVTVGKYFLAPDMHYIYDMENEIWKEQPLPKQRAIWIHCYSTSGKSDASQCLKGIRRLQKLAKSLERPLIIVGQVNPVDAYFRKHSRLKQQLENQLASDQIVILQKEAMGEKSFERRHYIRSLTKIFFSRASAEKLQLQIKEWLRYQSNPHYFERMPHNRQTLYQDSFYEFIPENQKLYMPLSPFDKETCEYYEGLGVTVICLSKKYIILYDEKQKLDGLIDQLADRIYPNYEAAILSRAPIDRRMINSNSNGGGINQTLRYKGENVYIGIISQTGIDYTKDFLRTSSGESRIAQYWVQQEANEGVVYTKEQINEALASDMPENIVPLQREENYTTTILGLVGGKIGTYEAIATQAEFLVAQVNEAPSVLQRIYGGNTANPGILMPDMVIAAYHMLEVAQIANKPLVLIIPYNTNLSAHDGTSVYEQILGTLAMKQSCTLVAPTGEEANKNHHQTMADSGNFVPNVYLQAGEKSESLLGVVYMKNTLQEPITLYPPNDSEKSIRLDEKGVYNLRSGTVYTTGLQNDYQNGARMVRFRIENMNTGRWRIERIPSPEYSTARIDIWLAQETLNPYVTLSPSSPFVTLGSNSAIRNLVGVGSYDSENLVVLASSGRGYDWNGIVEPLCVTQGKKEIIIGGVSSGYEVSGTIVSAAFLAGAMAVIYDKWFKESEEPYANSLIMQNYILSNLTQQTGVTYPNPSQGYGIFDLRMLEDILNRT